MSALGDGYPLGQKTDQKAQESAVGGAKTSLKQMYSVWFESSVCSCVSLCMRQGSQGARNQLEGIGN